MSRHGFIQLCVLCCLLLAGCAQQFADENSDQVLYSPAARITLSAPPSSMLGQSWRKLLQVNYDGEQTQQLLAHVEISKTGTLSMMATTVAGIPLFSLAMTSDGKFETQQYVPLKGLNPKYIAADLQWVHWPVATLNENSQGIVVQEKRQQQKRARKVMLGGRKFIDIEYASQSITLTNALFNYEIIFEEVEQ